MQIQQQKIDNEKSVNISFNYDTNGNFDIKKFISSVDKDIQQQNKEKARQMMIDYNKKIEAERAERNKIKQTPLVRTVVDLNRTLLRKVNSKADQTCEKLKNIVKESKHINMYELIMRIIIRKEQRQMTLKPQKRYQQISSEIDQMSSQEIMMKLFHFDQMETVNK